MSWTLVPTWAPAVRPTPLRLNACLTPLLDHLRWRGSSRQLAEATGLRDLHDLTDLRNAMARLGFSSDTRKGRLTTVDTRLLPCLFLSPTRALAILSTTSDGALRCFDCATASYEAIDPTAERGLMCTFELDERTTATFDPASSWLKQLVGRFQGVFALLLSLTLILNLLALVPVFFVQSVYDQILPTRNLTTLWAFVGGIATVLAADVCLRLIRGAVMAHLGARLDFLVGSTLLGKLLSLPASLLDGMTDAAKLAQLREGGIVRNLLAGSLALSLLELPFIVIFIVTLAYIGGWLALVPLVTVSIAAATGLLLIRALRIASRRRALRMTDHQALLVEMLSNLTAIKASGTEALWRERFRERSAQSAVQSLHEIRLGGLTETIAYVTNIASGAATLITGAAMALNGDFSVGTLIASMTIVWRLLAPVQAIFVALTRIDQIRQSGDRLTRFMRTPSEARVNGGIGNTTRARRFAGRVAFDRVFLRYDNHHEPSLAGISFNIEAGEIVAIAGGNGSGKSSILKLIAALLQPQMGTISIDGVDTRQIHPQDLRQWVTLLPQRTSLFDGSIRDNLLLANPTASDDDLWDVLAQVGLVDDVRALPQELDSAADEHFSEGFIKRLALARTLLVDAPIVLLDEPNVLADDRGDDLVVEQLHMLRGRATVLLATHHPEHVKAADRAIVLRHGTIIHDGTPQELMKRLAETAR